MKPKEIVGAILGGVLAVVSLIAWYFLHMDGLVAFVIGTAGLALMGKCLDIDMGM